MNEEMYIGFESYLANEMPADERKSFEEKLQNDAQFKAQFELYKETTQFISTAFSPETVAFKMNLDKISTEHFSETEEKTRVINLKPWYYAVAATMAIVFGTILYNQSDPQYSDYSQHETAQFMERGDADVHLKQAQQFFNEHQFEKAAIAFEQAASTNNPEVLYFYSISLIETNQYRKADLILTELKKGTSVYQHKATWYLALSNLKQNKTAECILYLEQIPPGADDYSKAQKLLSDLE